MSTLAEHEPATSSAARAGDFVWYELRTTDAKAAEEFYTHVVGWQPKHSNAPGGMPYTLLAAGEADVAGMMELTPQMLAGGMQPAWAGFLGVDDVDAHAERLEHAGGKLHYPPQGIPGVGRFASVEDPQGASFLLFKGSPSAPPTLPVNGTPGTVGWSELSADDGESAWPWYSSLFGWTEDSTLDMGPKGIYRMFNNGGAPVGAIMTRDKDMSAAPFWLFYFHVDEINAATHRVREKQGQVLMGPHEVPGNLWIVLGKDPQGALFALLSGSNR